jgi:hypothetical protein
MPLQLGPPSLPGRPGPGLQMSGGLGLDAGRGQLGGGCDRRADGLRSAGPETNQSHRGRTVLGAVKHREKEGGSTVTRRWAGRAVRLAGGGCGRGD